MPAAQGGPGAGLGKDADPAYIEAVARYMRAAASPSAVYAYEQMNGLIDTRPILSAIKAPTLVMNRTGDPVAHIDAARDMARRIPGAQFKEYPGNSHSMILDDIETILSDIQEFVTGERPVDASDRILATVLFLDIASSTERATALGDAAWRNVLNAYYSIVRKELARFRGSRSKAPPGTESVLAIRIRKLTKWSVLSVPVREWLASNLTARPDSRACRYGRACSPAHLS